ncbi:hypothetical protein C8D92_103117 [Tamilnaduibacter salinus]|uniref:Uncharacterized protein n=1 Tax=Tamilnaduibacter salinus TaxID=1484056 RepID=A0A2A2I6N4_9GAMM|nr:hypothetical protein [Tamilnaduibacter salinus]PAV26934.1 hypothetical protein CF392_03645 [Tamilnaduibacter salinus]PVY77432.1 hypothetical protein C8D92_103117 [Tamilnaduibacter salinus]
MTPTAVLDIIDQARRQEARSGTFLEQMKRRSQQLPESVVVQDDDPGLCLFQFAIEYIEVAPRLIDCVETCAHDARIYWLFEPFVQAAIRYFTQPSVMLTRYDGLDGLLIKAYLCHRLMEEMYENNYSIRSSQLVDVEATQANLVAHHLIGEPFANELDESITITVIQIAGSPDYYDLNLAPFVEQARDDAWQQMRQHWEQLLSRNQIRFALGPGLDDDAEE